MSRVKIVERCRLAPLDWALAAGVQQTLQDAQNRAP